METDKTPQCVKDVLDKPGFYIFDNLVSGFCWAFEVDEEGKVYQLEARTLKRGDCLSPEGWKLVSNFGTVKPLDRVAWLAQFE